MILRVRTPIVIFALALLALLVAVGPAAADVLTPESGGSSNADATDSLYKFVLYIAITVFVLVEGALFYAAFKFKKRSHSQEAGELKDNTALEIGWTAGAAAILAVLAVATFIKLDEIKDPPVGKLPPPQQVSNQAAQPATTDSSDEKLTIEVTGQQYLWRYSYPDGTFSFHDLVVPEDTVVTLNIRSADVAHSWYIPKLGGKRDALPGYQQSTWFKAEQPAVYKGQCAELCGYQHANMKATVRVVTKPEYHAWLVQNKADISAAQEGLKRLKKVFTKDPSNQQFSKRDAVDGNS